MENDLISRAALLEKIESHYGVDPAYFGDDALMCHELVKFAPSIEAEPKWISVKERLPEDWKRVLASIRHKHSLEDGYRDTIVTHRSERYGWTLAGDYYEITHWMPLPEPPKMDGGAEG